MARASKPSTAAKPAKKPTKRRAKVAPKVWRPKLGQDPLVAPRAFLPWLGKRGDPTPEQIRARLVAAVAQHGRLGLACALAGTTTQTLRRWRKAGEKQLREIERKGAAYEGDRELAAFVLDLEAAGAWWEAGLQSILQQAAERGNLAVAMWLLRRQDQLLGRLNGTEIHEHYEAPSATGDGLLAKFDQIIARRQQLRQAAGGE